MTNNNALEHLFKPKTVAIFNAKRIVRNFVEGFQTQGFNLENLYLISLSEDEVSGVKCYKSFAEIPADTIDLLILAVRRDLLIQTLQEILAQKKVKFIHIFTAGTGESDERGFDIEKGIKEMVDKQDISTRVIGPNCMGVYCPSGKIAYLRSFPVEQGNIALVFQSGDLHTKMVKFGSTRHGLKFSMGASIGNCVDLQISDLLKYYNDNDETDLICVYFEGFSKLHKHEGVKLLNTFKSMRKPVLFINGGKTERGQTAVLTHTGSVGTSQKIWKAIFKQTPIIEVSNSLDDLIDRSYVFSKVINSYKDQGKEVQYPKGKKTLVILWSGGFGIIATNTLTELGLEMPYFTGATLEKLRKVHPLKIGSLNNPLDLPWIASSKEFLALSKAAISEDIDLVILEADAWNNMEGKSFRGYYSNLLQIKQLVESLDKIVMIVLHEYPDSNRNAFYDMLVKDGFIVFTDLKRAGKSYLALYEYGIKRSNLVKD